MNKINKYMAFDLITVGLASYLSMFTPGKYFMRS